MGTAAALLCAVLLLARPAAQGVDLGEARDIAPGASLYHLTDPSLLDPPAPASVWLLKLDGARVHLEAALANDEIVDTETVADLASRRGALAAINAGFFAPNGDPTGVLKLDQLLVSDMRRSRGAVGIVRDRGRTRLIFGRLRASARFIVGSGRRSTTLKIDGVDTTRVRGRLMLYTPAYHAHTATASGGLEWTFHGKPLALAGPATTAGAARIPRAGFVLSYRGTTPPKTLVALKRGARAELQIAYDADSPDDDWARAEDIVGGAGLLVDEGRSVEDWSVEELSKGFAENRHPRTMIGTGASGAIWLIAVDGRQPTLGAGMTLVELQRLAGSLGLTGALNLDGGGSTTMWVKGEIVNSPSDSTGPRKVSDALLVYPGGSPDR